MCRRRLAAEGRGLLDAGRTRDALLTRYLRRWPKIEKPYEPPPWADVEADAAEAEAAKMASEGDEN